MKDTLSNFRGREVKSKVCCPDCGSNSTGVIDSRLSAKGSVRRRRMCVNCKHRWVTYENMIDAKLDMDLVESALSEAKRALDEAMQKIQSIVDLLP